MSGKETLPQIKACLFDMDGLLIDSEDIYTLCTNEILREYGKPDLPWHMYVLLHGGNRISSTHFIKAQLQGRPAPEAGRIFSEWAQLPITREEFMDKTRVLQQKHFTKTQPLKGVAKLLKDLSNTSDPNIRLALATSSHRGNFFIKTNHLEELFSVFPEQQRILGDDPRIPPGRGKPAPDIYLLALKSINDAQNSVIRPEECLVFEDSVPGVEAGRRAGMQVIWCPHPDLLEEVESHGEDKVAQVLAGLTGEYREVVETPSAHLAQNSPGSPGDIGDGWALLLPNLESFPYEKFGINVNRTI